MFATRCKAIPGNLYRYCSFLCPSVSSFSRLFVRAFVVRSLVRSFVFSYVGSFARAFVVGIIGRRSFVCSLTCTLVPSFVRFRFCSFNYLFLSHSLICWSVRSFISQYYGMWRTEIFKFKRKAAKCELQKRSTCRATLIRCKIRVDVWRFSPRVINICCELKKCSALIG